MEQDKAQAAEWFKKAAGQGHIKAQKNLGIMYYDGDGVRQDKAMATEFFHQVSVQGNPYAQYIISASCTETVMALNRIRHKLKNGFTKLQSRELPRHRNHSANWFNRKHACDC